MSVRASASVLISSEVATRIESSASPFTQQSRVREAKSTQGPMNTSESTIVRPKSRTTNLRTPGLNKFEILKELI